MGNGFGDGVRRVLVYRLGSLGDMVVALPSLRAIRHRFPEGEIALLTNLPREEKAVAAASILDGTGLIDRFITYPLATREMGQLAGVVAAIRTFRPDIVFYLTEPRGTLKVCRDFAFFKLCGMRNGIGFPFTRDAQSCRAADAGGRVEREASRLARCLGPFGPQHPERIEEWDLGLSPAEMAAADTIIARELDGARVSRLLGVCIGTKQTIKDWGADNWTSTLSDLRDPACALVMIGAADERARSTAVAASWPGPVLNFCGLLPPRQSAAVIRRTELFLCHDSGPMHLAAAQGVRCVAVFSRKSPPGQWFPIGTGHAVLYPSGPDDSIRSIPPADVVAAARRLLASAERFRA